MMIMTQMCWSSVKEGVKASDSKRLQAIKKCLTNVTKKREDFAWMKELSSKVYQSALQDLQTAFSRWRKGIASAPTYKRRKDKRSFTVYDGNGVVLIPAELEYKAPVFGCKLDIIERWFPSSKQCRKCGQRNDALTLRDRTFVCSHCEHTESRDLHASKNLANAPEDKRSRIGSIRTDVCGQVAADCLG